MQSYKNICVSPDLKQAIDYVNRMPLLEVDVDELQAMYDRVEYNGNPSEECPICACLRGDVEVALTTAMDIQEDYENVVDTLEQIDETHPAYGYLTTYFNDLTNKYGGDTKK